MAAWLADRAGDKDAVAAALLAVNDKGAAAYHLFLQAGPSERAQEAALSVVDKVRLFHHSI